MRQKYIKTLLYIMVFYSYSCLAVDWPAAVGTCSGTLQACIDTSSDGTSIKIITNSNVLINNNLHIAKSINLYAGTGFHPRFVGVNFILTVSGTKKITIKGFEFEGATQINAEVYSDSELAILNNNWSSPNTVAGQPEGIRIISNATSGIASVNIVGNNIIGEGVNSVGLMHASQSTAGTLLLKFVDNHVTDLGENSTNDMISMINEIGTLGLQMVGNEIRGGKSQLKLSQTNTGYMEVGIISNLLTGVINESSKILTNSSNKSIDSNVDTGTFHGIFASNTIDGVKRDGVADGIGFDFSGHTTNVASLLYFFNNIIANTEQAYVGPATGTNMSEASDGYNIFHDYGTITGLSLSLTDSLTDPMFKNEGVNYALQDGSPAIDKSNLVSSHADIHDSAVTADAPDIDADGLRRFKGGFLDSGAYEWGDRHLLETATSIGNVVNLTDSVLNADAGALPMVTQVWNYDGESGVYNDHPIGLFRNAGIWKIFSEDQQAMSNGAKYHVFYPYGHVGNAFNGVSGYANPASPDSGFELIDPLFDNDSSVAIFATNYWDSSAGSVYNPSSLELGYKNSSNRWYVGNVDESDMSTGAQVFIYGQAASRNVYKHVVTEENTSSHITTLDHPLLNNNPCALPTVTQNTALSLFGQNPHNIGVFYSLGRWNIFNQDIADIDIDLGGGAVVSGLFNVMVDPQQVYDCNQPTPDLMFSDGFED